MGLLRTDSATRRSTWPGEIQVQDSGREPFRQTPATRHSSVPVNRRVPDGFRKYRPFLDV